MKDKVILLVDDEQEFVTTLAQRLELRGAIPLVAQDGENALSILEKRPVDLVVLDMLLPGISGLDVLQRIRKKYVDLPVVIVTGNTGTKEGIEAMKSGASACLPKPLDFQDFLDAIGAFFKQGANNA